MKARMHNVHPGSRPLRSFQLAGIASWFPGSPPGRLESVPNPVHTIPLSITVPIPVPIPLDRKTLQHLLRHLLPHHSATTNPTCRSIFGCTNNSISHIRIEGHVQHTHKKGLRVLINMQTTLDQLMICAFTSCHSLLRFRMTRIHII